MDHPLERGCRVNSLERRDGGSLWSEGQAYFLSGVTQRMSPSRAKVGQVCLQPGVQDWGLPTAGSPPVLSAMQPLALITWLGGVGPQGHEGTLAKVIAESH